MWDKVAKCESGNRWHISTGNGYYGGLQFSSGTWKAFGGRKYGSQAHKATKAEQIAIARRVLAGQGPGAWPTCSRRAGLTKANGKADKKAVPATNPGASKAKSTKPVVKKAKPAVKGQVDRDQAGQGGSRRHAGQDRQALRRQGRLARSVEAEQEDPQEPEPHLRRTGSARSVGAFWRGWVPAPQ